MEVTGASPTVSNSHSQDLLKEPHTAQAGPLTLNTAIIQPTKRACPSGAHFLWSVMPAL